MPQGGLDRARTRSKARCASSRRRPASPATSSRSSTQAKEELTYDLPDDLVGKMWKGKWRGQRQTWFLIASSARTATSTSTPPTPNSAPGNGPSRAELPAMIVPFKKKLYEELLEAFAEWL